MSVLLSNEHGWVISHFDYIKNIYKDVTKEEKHDYQLKKDLFEINSPFLRFNENINKYYSSNLKKKKRKIDYGDKFKELIETIKIVRKLYENMLSDNRVESLFSELSIEEKTNVTAQNLAEECYKEMNHNVPDSYGSNNARSFQKVNDRWYIFPDDCRFFCKNVSEIGNHLSNEKFDVILLDPPWWNKFVRRKVHNSDQGYEMMHNVDLKIIPVNDLLNENGIVVIWCTNSPQHFYDLYHKVFPVWNVKKIAKWFWLKVTTTGESICKFSEPPGKQPFEQIIIAQRNRDSEIQIPDEKIILSVPSAMNSHKPPLNELLTPYVKENGKFLEVFARYLLPGWTSWGNEVIKLQNEFLYE